jgi:hypothetical protein
VQRGEAQHAVLKRAELRVQQLDMLIVLMPRAVLPPRLCAPEQGAAHFLAPLGALAPQPRTARCGQCRPNAPRALSKQRLLRLVACCCTGCQGGCRCDCQATARSLLATCTKKHGRGGERRCERQRSDALQRRLDSMALQCKHPADQARCRWRPDCPVTAGVQQPLNATTAGHNRRLWYRDGLHYA